MKHLFSIILLAVLFVPVEAQNNLGTADDAARIANSGINVPLVADWNVPPVAQSNVPPQKWLR